MMFLIFLMCSVVLGVASLISPWSLANEDDIKNDGFPRVCDVDILTNRYGSLALMTVFGWAWQVLVWWIIIIAVYCLRANFLQKG